MSRSAAAVGRLTWACGGCVLRSSFKQVEMSGVPCVPKQMSFKLSLRQCDLPAYSSCLSCDGHQFEARNTPPHVALLCLTAEHTIRINRLHEEKGMWHAPTMNPGAFVLREAARRQARHELHFWHDTTGLLFWDPDGVRFLPHGCHCPRGPSIFPHGGGSDIPPAEADPLIQNLFSIWTQRDDSVLCPHLF
ncbi:hypothetical protein FB451DRAFT_1250155 [Mycena latifolia]|nr:hypothetical protein FB451DRAFT_1250155 [Mycena latifolia]